MDANDRALLDFDASKIAHFDRTEAEELLAGEHGDLYRNHLVIARWIDQFRDGVMKQHRAGWLEKDRTDYYLGWENAMNEVAAHLRQGDFMPNDPFIRENTPVGD